MELVIIISTHSWGPSSVFHIFFLVEQSPCPVPKYCQHSWGKYPSLTPTIWHHLFGIYIHSAVSTDEDRGEHNTFLPPYLTSHRNDLWSGWEKDKDKIPLSQVEFKIFPNQWYLSLEDFFLLSRIFVIRFDWRWIWDVFWFCWLPAPPVLK